MKKILAELKNKKQFSLAKQIEKLFADAISDAIEDLKKVAKDKSLKEFVYYFGDISHKFFKQNKESELRKRLIEDILGMKKYGGILGKDLWYKFNDISPIIYNKGKVTVEALNDKVLKRMGSLEKKIITSLADFTNKIVKRDIYVTIGEQWVSVGNPGSMRISIPDTKYDINLIMPYNRKVIPAFKKMQDLGIPSQWLWAATDWFHELAHALGENNEKKADTFSFNYAKKFFSKKYPKVKEISLIKKKDKK